MKFQGNWICAQEFLNAPPQNVFRKETAPKSSFVHPEDRKNVHMLVRREFSLPAFSSAILHITADDYYKLYVNGVFVAQGPTPGYYFHYYYNTIDLSSYLKEGENIIALDVYYQGLINRVWNSGDMRQGCIADLVIDGKTVLSTDKRWKYILSRAYTCRRELGYSTQYLEDYDSRLEEKGWETLGFQDGHWHACRTKFYTDYIFSSHPAPVIPVYSVKPEVLSPLENGRVVYDFGKEVTGTLAIRARGGKGRKIRILCGEELEEGTRDSVRYHMRCNCDYEEFWTLDDGECLLRQYDYKAFRYVCLEMEEGVELLELSGSIRHFPMDDALCTLETSDKVLKSVFELCKNGVKCGSQEVYVDCPSREKGQYAGDMTITTISQLYLSGDPYLYRKALENQMQSAFVCDGLLTVTPGSLMQEIADYSFQFPMIALRYYQHSHDKEFLLRTLEVSDKMLSYFRRRYARPDGLLEQVEEWNLVDWPTELRDHYDFPMTKPIGPGCHNVINAFYIGSVGVVEQTKQMLGLPFSPRYASLIQSFQRAFYRPETRLYVDSEHSNHSALHSNMLPAYFGFCPPEAQDSIASLIMERGLCCGVYMSYFLLKALVRLGRYEEVYSLLTSTARNSWYNMVREGGTACFEAWGKEDKNNCSLCHPWASAPVSILIEDILGLHPCEEGETPVYIPHIPERVSYLKMTVPVQNYLITVLHENGKTTYTRAPRKKG